MIKLKLQRSQLYCLCNFTAPAKYEQIAKHGIRNENFAYLDFLFNLIQIGEKATRQYLYSNKKKCTVSLNYSEAASLLAHTRKLETEIAGGYDLHVLRVLKNDLNHQLTNYQSRFYNKQV